MLGVGLPPGGDQHRVDVVGGNQVRPGRVHPGAAGPLGHRGRPGTVHVGHRGDPCPGEHPGEPADVILADHADPDGAHPDRHRAAPIPSPRRYRRVRSATGLGTLRSTG